MMVINENITASEPRCVLLVIFIIVICSVFSATGHIHDFNCRYVPEWSRANRAPNGFGSAVGNVVVAYKLRDFSVQFAALNPWSYIFLLLLSGWTMIACTVAL